MSILSDKKAVKFSEMTEHEQQFLRTILKNKQPKKVLEIGMSAGGTTVLLLEELARETILYSVDINEFHYRDKQRKSGFIADEFYDRKLHAEWIKLTGKDISFFIEQIGSDIDFVILDTVHRLPGGVLDFVTILPYLNNDACIIIHDIGLHALYKLKSGKNTPMHKQHCYSCSLLYSAINSEIKISYGNKIIPNIGCIEINKQNVWSFPKMVDLL